MELYFPWDLSHQLGLLLNERIDHKVFLRLYNPEQLKYQWNPILDPPSEFTAIDTPIPGVFPPMGNGYETVIIIQSTDANQGLH